MGFIKEFKEFAIKGNVIDMAVGIIIGTAFGKIVSSLVNDIIMPPIGFLLADMKFANLRLILREAIVDDSGNVLKEAVAINYGNFIQTAIDFTLIALSIFLVIKGINRLKRKEEAAPAAPPEPTAQEKLLMEIRDLLKIKRP